MAMNIIQKKDLKTGFLESTRMRSGSPGSRQPCKKLIKDSMNSHDPKEFLKSHFKNDMKRLGLNKEMKNLKTFKVLIQSRSHETIDTIDHHNNGQPSIVESESTTLERTDDRREIKNNNLSNTAANRLKSQL